MTDLIGIQALKSRQSAWAAKRGIDLDEDGYCTTLERNLFRPLSAGCRAEFEISDGGELGKGEARGKIQALHSSAALACNFFDYWRDLDLNILCGVFGLAAQPGRLAFEQRFATGLGGIGPNLDVVLYQQSGVLFAIESKFTEPYGASKLKCYLKPKYFLDGRRLWTELRLPGCQALAEKLRTGRVRFEFLDAAQLLKHMLGLARTGRAWRLCCLWYQLSGPTGEQHAKELQEFSRHLGPDASRFDSLTYQALFARMTLALGHEHDAYLFYLRDRYFAPALQL